MDEQMKLTMTGIILELFFMLLRSYQQLVRTKAQKITVDKVMIGLLILNLEISVITLEICTVKFFFYRLWSYNNKDNSRKNSYHSL
jgi:uncharacterized membrane protein